MTNRLDEIGIACDIDETLSWTVGLWMEKLSELFGNPENLSPRQMADKYRYTQNVPYWQTKEAREWQEEKASSSEFQELLPLIEGSNLWLNRIHKEIVKVKAYATIRSVSTLNGTMNWLKRHEFPKARVIARPMELKLEEGNKWKANLLLSSYPDISGIIDDNLGVVRNLGEDYKGVIFLYGHNSKPETKIEVIPCRDWKAVYEAVRGRFSRKI